MQCTIPDLSHLILTNYIIITSILDPVLCGNIKKYNKIWPHAVKSSAIISREENALYDLWPIVYVTIKFGHGLPTRKEYMVIH